MNPRNVRSSAVYLIGGGVALTVAIVFLLGDIGIDAASEPRRGSGASRDTSQTTSMQLAIAHRRGSAQGQSDHHRGARGEQVEDVPSPPRTGAEERQEIAASLKQSGPSAEPWTGDAQRAIAAWASEKRITHGSVTCYATGCTTTVYANDAARLRELRENIANRTELAWGDGLVLTAIETTDSGESEFDLILRPRTDHKEGAQ